MDKIKEIILGYWLPALILMVIAAGSLFESTSFKTDGPWLKVRKGAKVYSRLGNDTIVTGLTPADSVRFIGYVKAYVGSDCLVETSGGVRGWMPMWMLDTPMLIASKEFKGDTVTLDNPAKVLTDKYGPYIPVDDGIKGTLPDGQRTGNLMTADIHPAIRDYEDYLIQTRHRFTGLMSEKKFDRIVSGLDFSRAADKIGPMTDIARDGKGALVASFRTYVFDKEDGKFYTPVVTFGADSVASSSALFEATDRSDWLLRYLPMFYTRTAA